jgi:hypothetical protein
MPGPTQGEINNFRVKGVGGVAPVAAREIPETLFRKPFLLY